MLVPEIPHKIFWVSWGVILEGFGVSKECLDTLLAKTMSREVVLEFTLQES